MACDFWGQRHNLPSLEGSTSNSNGTEVMTASQMGYVFLGGFFHPFKPADLFLK